MPTRAKGAKENTMPIIAGNTYPHRFQLKRLGGRWLPHLKAWDVPQNNIAEARAIMAGQWANFLAQQAAGIASMPTAPAQVENLTEVLPEEEAAWRAAEEDVEDEALQYARDLGAGVA